MAREVITLQFGGLANFTGAHYWNLQVAFTQTECLMANIISYLIFGLLRPG